MMLLLFDRLLEMQVVNIHSGMIQLEQETLFHFQYRFKTSRVSHREVVTQSHYQQPAFNLEQITLAQLPAV